MSGILGALESLDLALDPYLRVAAWRGVTFAMVDSTDEVGRRWVRFLFPGRDDTQHEDLGALDGDIRIKGVIIGEDYVRRAARMRAAFRAAGPGTLTHPWLGELQVVLSEKAPISFSDREMGCARFEAVFQIWQAPAVPVLDTLGQLLDQLSALQDEAALMSASLLGRLALPVAAVRYVSALLLRTASGWGALLAGGGGTAFFRRSAAAPVAALASPSIAGTGSDYAAGVSALLVAPAAAIADSVVPAATPAVGSGSASDSSTEIPPDPRLAAQLLLNAASTVSQGATAAEAAQDAATPAVMLPVTVGARAAILAEAVRAASSIDFVDQAEAVEWRDRLDAALGTLAGQVAQVSATSPLAARGTWQAVRATRTALVADMSARIGRLPAVATLTTPTTLSAWLIAQRISGDDPAAVQATMLEIVRRNRVRHPAMVPAGDVEYLA